MTNDERTQLEVLRAELNGKLDVIIERVGNLKEDWTKVESRMSLLENRVDKLNLKVYMAAGVIAFLSFAIMAIANAWPFH